MPFTVSHVAAVIPAHRWLARWHVFSAAVIGAMTPDFSILLPLRFARWQTHSLAGLFNFCLPVGLCAFWITQLLLKPAMLEILPDRAYVRLRREHPRLSPRSLRNWALAALAILAGAVTHLVWDGFTHEDARGVAMFPVLVDYGPDLQGHPLQLYRWLQYGSSVVGLLLVLLAMWLWWRHAPEVETVPVRRLGPIERGGWLSLYFIVPLVLICLTWARLLLRGVEPFGSAFALSRLAIAGMHGCALAFIVVSAAVLWRVAGEAT